MIAACNRCAIKTFTANSSSFLRTCKIRRQTTVYGINMIEIDWKLRKNHTHTILQSRWQHKSERRREKKHHQKFHLHDAMHLLSAFFDSKNLISNKSDPNDILWTYSSYHFHSFNVFFFCALCFLFLFFHFSYRVPKMVNKIMWQRLGAHMLRIMAHAMRTPMRKFI